MEVLFIIIIWIVLTVVASKTAAKKGRPTGMVIFLSIVLSPLIGIIVALAMGEDKDAIESKEVASGGQRKCPFCAEMVKSEAIVCKHCGKELPVVEEAEEVAAEIAEPAGNTWTCTCGAVNLGRGEQLQILP